MLKNALRQVSINGKRTPHFVAPPQDETYIPNQAKMNPARVRSLAFEAGWYAARTADGRISIILIVHVHN
jgi:hypothetical protein